CEEQDKQHRRAAQELVRCAREELEDNCFLQQDRKMRLADLREAAKSGFQ
ncbi:unnamed protein product, partial [Urochloa humidicola]